MKALRWVGGVTVKTPPISLAARIEIGTLLLQVQRGVSLSMPHSRPMPSMGARVHELRVNDESVTWRVIYRVDGDAIVVVDVFEKKTQQTRKADIERSQRRLRQYDEVHNG